MKKYFFLSFILLGFTSSDIVAQKDTAFWFAPPQICKAVGYFGGNIDTPIYVRISTYDLPATVTLYQPANVSFVPITETIAANSAVSVALSSLFAYLETAPADNVLNTGLKITATAPISAYYDAESIVSPEIFTLKGQNGIGTSFWIPGQNVVNNATYGSSPSNNSFDIVATEDNTVITITPAQPVVGHASGVSYTETLNTGQTYSAAATSTAPSAHLQGSTVTSTKPIAITVKDDLLDASSIWGNGQDLTGDQIVPVTQIGTEYIAVRGQLEQPYDEIFILATQSNTTISLDGGYIATINAGDNYGIFMANPSSYIQTNNPVYVWQLSGLGGELGAGILPPITCTGSNQVAYVRADGGQNGPLYIMLVVESGGQNNFLFNGSSSVLSPSVFAAVPGTNGQWVAAQFQINDAQLAQGSAVLISNSTNLFHMGVVNGTTDAGASFGYFSNFNSFALPASNSVSGCNQVLHLQTDSVPGAIYSWAGPHGFASSAVNPVILNPTIQDTGNYMLTATYNGCTGISSTNVQLLGGTIAVLASNTISGCNQFLHLRADSLPGAVYLWTGPNGFSSSAVNPVISNPTIQDTGNYTLSVRYNGCSGISITNAQLAVAPVAVQPLAKDTIICSGDSTQICVADTFASYLWNTGSNTACIYANAAGGYWVTVTTANGCTAITKHADVDVYPVPSVSIIVTGDTLVSFNSLSYQWYFQDNPIPGATTSVYIAHQIGNYSVQILDTNGCKTVSNNFYVASVGISEISFDNLEIYPNPSAGLLFIHYTGSDNRNIKLSAFNVIGKKLIEQELNFSSEATHSVDLSRFAEGVYMLQLQSEQYSITRKVIRQ